MPLFAIEAIDTNGQRVRKEVDAKSKDDAIKQARAEGLRPHKVMVKQGGADRKAAAKPHGEPTATDNAERTAAGS